MPRAMIEGRIEFDRETPRFDAGDVHVYVEDTTYADEPAGLLSHLRIPDVSYPGGPGDLAFRVDDDSELPPGRTRTLRVLVDLDRDGQPGSGDFVSFQAVRVPSRGETARLRVRRIS